MTTESVSRIVVFLGPTLDHWLAASLAEADFNPPAAMGHITRAVAKGADGIVLVDGVFESGPAVWHKEILLAMAAGIPVVGASSMGALRAAELHTFGMLGHGQVFSAFASGDETDDDEVAVIHGPAETGWIQLSDAMIDMRDSLKSAVASNVLSQDEAERVTQHAKSTFFKHRNLKASLRAALSHSREESDIEDIIGWLNANTTSLKRRDCQSLLENLPGVMAQAREKLSLAPGPVPTRYLNSLRSFGYTGQKGLLS
jgi:hypothetical protein